MAPGLFGGVLPVPQQDVVGPDAGHDEGTGGGGSDHGVRVLPDNPWVQEERPDGGEVEVPVGLQLITNGMLHEGIGGDDEEARDP